MLNTALKAIFGSRNDRLLKQYRKTVEAINALNHPQFLDLDHGSRLAFMPAPAGVAPGSQAAERATS